MAFYRAGLLLLGLLGGRTNVILSLRTRGLVDGRYGNREAHTRCSIGWVQRHAFTRAFSTIPSARRPATFFTGASSRSTLPRWIKNENVGPRSRYCLEAKRCDDVLAKKAILRLSGNWQWATVSSAASYRLVHHPKGFRPYQNADVIRTAKYQSRGYITDRNT